MNPYKCENHKLDLVCRGCMKAWIARHNRMLEFIKEVAPNFETGVHIQAQKLLKEIGELPQKKDAN